ncbi:hypothetical protein COCON_G00037310 [Conger conger]|uniref:G-protein coupled receptors family 1 profile domain-containing protein n=2 Tax=Conger conger TaxID=82655 RepID=A0A9Q1I7S2_CONCO|nr:hypothetical protein COCON_G00037310 [Conger conger]
MLFVQQLEVKYDFLYEHHHVCCQEHWKSMTQRQVYTTCILMALFLLPLAVMLILYTRIALKLWIHKRVGDSSVLSTMNHSEVNKISRKKKRAVKMMITVVLLFTVCWAPFHVVQMLCEFNDLEKKYDEVTVNMIIAIVQAIGFFNSFNNPIVYAFMNENFQKNCMSTLCGCLKKPIQCPVPTERPKLTVHFTKPKEEAFLVDTHMVHSSGDGPSGTSHRKTFTAFIEEKTSTENSQLPSSSYSQ